MLKKVVVGLLFALSLVFAGCTTDGIRTMGSIENPDGSFGQSYSKHSRDAFGHEIIQIETRETASVYNPVRKKYEPKTTVVTQQAAGGPTWESAAVAGFVSNLPNTAGDVFGAWVLRGANWGTTVVNNVDGAIATGATATATANSVNKNFNSNTNKNTNTNANINVNTNTNTNINKNVAKGGKGGNGGGSGGDKPGNGNGDKNHDHTGPPGQNK